MFQTQICTDRFVLHLSNNSGDVFISIWHSVPRDPVIGNPKSNTIYYITAILKYRNSSSNHSSQEGSTHDQ